MAGLDTAALRLEDEVVLDVAVISLLVEVVELVVAVVEEVVILTGFALLGGFGILILETVISVVCILTLLGETDWKRGGSATGGELILQSETLPRGDIYQNVAKKYVAGLLVNIRVTVNGGEGFLK